MTSSVTSSDTMMMFPVQFPTFSYFWSVRLNDVICDVMNHDDFIEPQFVPKLYQTVLKLVFVKKMKVLQTLTH